MEPILPAPGLKQWPKAKRSQTWGGSEEGFVGSRAARGGGAGARSNSSLQMGFRVALRVARFRIFLFNYLACAIGYLVIYVFIHFFYINRCLSERYKGGVKGELLRGEGVAIALGWYGYNGCYGEGVEEERKAREQSQ